MPEVDEKLIDALLYALVMIGDRESTIEMTSSKLPVPKIYDTIELIKEHRKQLMYQQAVAATAIEDAEIDNESESIESEGSPPYDAATGTGMYDRI